MTFRQSITGGRDLTLDSLKLTNKITEISNDDTLTDNSDSNLITEKAIKTYISSVVHNLDFQASVLTIFDNSSALPSSPSDGDRHIAAATANGWTIHYIYEYDGSSSLWTSYSPNEGWTCVVEGGSVYSDRIVTYSGSAWVLAGSRIGQYIDLVDTPGSYTTGNALYTTNSTPDGIIETLVQLEEPSANNLKFTKGSSIFDIQTSATINQDLSSTSSPSFNKLTLTTLSMTQDVTKIDTDSTLAGDSDSNLPTQKAVKGYVDTIVATKDEFTELNDTPASYTTGNALLTTNATPDALIETTTQMTEPSANRFTMTKGSTAFDCQADLTVSGNSAVNQDVSTTGTPWFSTLTTSSSAQASNRNTGAILATNGGIGCELDVYAGGNIRSDGGGIIGKQLGQSYWYKAFTAFDPAYQGFRMHVYRWSNSTDNHVLTIGLDWISGGTFPDPAYIEHHAIHMYDSTRGPIVKIWEKDSDGTIYIYYNVPSGNTYRVWYDHLTSLVIPDHSADGDSTNSHPDTLGGNGGGTGYTLKFDSSDLATYPPSSDYHTGSAHFYDTTDASDKDTASVVLEGGIAVEKKAFIGTDVNIGGLTASQMVSTNGDKTLSSVSDLNTFFSAVANQTSLSGTSPLSIGTVQDINTSSSPQFTNLKLGTSSASKNLTINDASGGSIRLVYNDADGSETNYVDLVVGSSGQLQITPSNSSMYVYNNISLENNGILYGKFSRQVCSINGAIGVTNSGSVLITKAGVCELTLADPTATDQDGLQLDIISCTANAHTVSNAAGSGFNGGGSASDVASFGGAISDSMRICANAGVWWTTYLNNVTLG